MPFHLGTVTLTAGGCMSSLRAAARGSASGRPNDRRASQAAAKVLHAGVPISNQAVVPNALSQAKKQRGGIRDTNSVNLGSRWRLLDGITLRAEQ